MTSFVALVDVCDLWHQGVIWVGVSQQRADGEKHLRNGESGRPLVLEDVQADRTVAVDVHMVDLRGESDLGRLEGVVGREVDVQEEDALVVGRVLGAHDGSLPVELVCLVGGAGRAVCGRVSSKVDQLLLDSFKCHFS